MVYNLIHQKSKFNISLRKEGLSMSNIIFNRMIPVTAEADVVVAGGGLGGISAAFSAAQAGSERNTAEDCGCAGG